MISRALRYPRILKTIVVAFLLCGPLLQAQQLIVSASKAQVRLPEVLEIPLADVRRHVPHLESKMVEIARTHEQLVTQIDESSDPSQALFLIALQMPADGKLVLNFLDGQHTAKPVPLVFGREAPERKDDFAWENQLVTYRVYGPALEATGEITSGIDVWSKRVPALVIDRFYKHDAEGARTHNPALSYHKDDGVGLDSYEVGPSRGCGGTAILSENKAWVSKNYTHLKVIAAGPVRFAFEMTYAPWNANGTEVTETKRITLDAGTHLNKIQSTFRFAGQAALTAAAGLAVHPGAELQPLREGQIFSVWDTPQDPGAGRIATGLVALPEQHSEFAKTSGQGWLAFHVHSGQPFTYYAGSGWSKSDMPTPQAWKTYLESTLTQLQYPLQIHWASLPSSNSASTPVSAKETP